ncbi:hypothetical protein HU200_034076 [Digitaria exilis]|uniref:Uncharacterized protein n=1 Tax=Digitaria exilis TaxID=1010633 RepID=A0A835BL87_9POAL|nr:hypothetical protein HU200_034076 [Digitaria exilis]
MKTGFTYSYSAAAGNERTRAGPGPAWAAAWPTGRSGAPRRRPGRHEGAAPTKGARREGLYVPHVEPDKKRDAGAGKTGRLGGDEAKQGSGGGSSSFSPFLPSPSPSPSLPSSRTCSGPVASGEGRAELGAARSREEPKRRFATRAARMLGREHGDTRRASRGSGRGDAAEEPLGLCNIKDHPRAKGLYGIPSIYFDTFDAIYGKERYTGEEMEGSEEAIANMENNENTNEVGDGEAEDDGMSAGQSGRSLIATLSSKKNTRMM